ncbi:Arginase/deacetylase [Auricularia subglabra TFB-10046 SS5]|nr:Arginase/deacetylase [Auricularia subglabra TFB-10046 SS5]
MRLDISLLAVLIAAASGHEHHHEQEPVNAAPPTPETEFQSWLSKYGKQEDLPFSGPLSFSHVPYTKCLENPDEAFDIAILGMPFDTTVSYRPGARFGPFGIRAGSRRQRPGRGYVLHYGFNPYTSGMKVIDCGDVPISPVHNGLALDQMEVAYADLLKRPVVHDDVIKATRAFTVDGIERPRIVTLGGDHTIVLPILRALHGVYGPISVIHFDAHLDTWASPPIPAPYEAAEITHGTFFTAARKEGLLTNSSVHAGIRCKFAGIEDLEHDDAMGFALVTTDDIDDLGVEGIIEKIRNRVGSAPVYLSLDIDVLDPAFAPATGTPEAGGFTTRELKRILRGLVGLNFVGADLVEVAPAYDTNAETTATVAADLVHEFLSSEIGSSSELVDS